MRKNNKDRQKLKVYVLYVLHVIHTHDTHHCPLKSNGERAGNLLPVREALAGCRGAALTRGSKGMKSLFKDTKVQQDAKHVVATLGSLFAFEFTHRFSHLWRNV